MTSQPRQASTASRFADGLGSRFAEFQARVRGGDLGPLPVIVGLVIIAVVFQLLNPVFLSANNLVNLTLQFAAGGTIAIGIVLVLLVGQIDLSVGSVSGLAAAILGVGMTQLGWNLALSILVAIAAGVGIGLLYGVLYNRFGVPSFIITLAGLLGVLGLQLWVLGDTGSINIPDSPIVDFARSWFLPPWAAYLLAAIGAGGMFVSELLRRRRRERSGLTTSSLGGPALRAGLLFLGMAIAVWYLATDRGMSVMFVFFVGLVVLVNVMLVRTRWGRNVYAVGGSVEAARRAGIRVDRVYVSVFVLCSTFAVLGGLLAAARLTNVEPPERRRRHQPQRDRRRGDRRNQPVRRARFGLVRPARDRRHPVDLERPDPAQPRRLDPVHDHRRRAAAGRHHRLAVAQVASEPRASLKPA